MKKVKILSLILLVALVVATFTSCAGIGSAGSYNKLINSKYIPEDMTFNKASSLSELEGYAFADSNDEIALFTSGEEGMLSYKVYSFADCTIIKTLISDSSKVYTVSLCGNLPVFYVCATTVSEEPTTTYALYDAKGTKIVESDKNVGAPIALDGKMIYDYEFYALNEEGVFVKDENAEAIPEYISIINYSFYNDDYLYVIDGDTVNVYNKSFAPVSCWIAPSYAEKLTVKILDNGYIFAQYVVALESDAVEYDYYEKAEDGTVVKYDLVTLTVNPKNGKEKSYDIDYVVTYLTTYTEAKNSIYTDETMFNAGFKNLAAVYPIIDKQVDSSDYAEDIVLMNNNCAMKSLKLADQQLSNLPVKLNKDYFIVDTFYGSAVVTAKGKTVYTFTKDAFTANSEYVVGEKAIYTIDTFESVYDLEEKNAEVINVINSALFIREGSADSSYKVIMLRNGVFTDICTYDPTTTTGKTFSVVDGIGCYALYDAATAEYTYYNLDGEALTTSKQALLPLAYSAKYNTMILCDLESNLGYCAFSVAAADTTEEKK